MKFAFYYRTSPDATETKIGRGEAESLDDARSLAENAVKAKFPSGTLLGVCDASDAIDPVDLNRIYAAYYRVRPRSSESETVRIVANSRADANRMAHEILVKTYPSGSIMGLVLAKNSPVPVINAHGAGCAASMVY